MLLRQHKNYWRTLWPAVLVMACGCASAFHRPPTDEELLRAMASGDAQDIKPARGDTEEDRLLENDLDALDALVNDARSLRKAKNEFAVMDAEQRRAILGYLRAQEPIEPMQPPITVATDTRRVPDTREDQPSKSEPDRAPAPPQPEPATASADHSQPASAAATPVKPAATSPTPNVQQASHQSLVDESTDLVRNRANAAAVSRPAGSLGQDIEQAQRPHSDGSPYPESNGRYLPDPVPTPAEQANLPISATVTDTAGPSGTPSSIEDWQDAVGQAIKLLEDEVYSGHQSDAEKAKMLEATLHVLYASAGRTGEAALPMVMQKDDDLKVFWRQVLWAISTQLKADDERPSAERAADTLSKLRVAERMLTKASQRLQIKNVKFCREVQGFGQYVEFDKYEFASEERVVLYFEVENFLAREVNDGFETKLQGGYVIYDSKTTPIANRDFPASLEFCRNHRRDFFMRYIVPIPKHLEPGSYTLDLTVKDEFGKKFGQGAVDFKIR